MQRAYAEQTYVSLDVRVSSCNLDQNPASDEQQEPDLLQRKERARTIVFRGTVEEVILGPSPRLGRFVAEGDVPVGVPKRGEAVVLSAPRSTPRFCKEAPGQARRFTLSKPCEESELQTQCYLPFAGAKAVEDEE